jgi:O-antigen/teichoic acid export membrane protein
MTLIKTSILSFIATAIRLLSALVVNKAIALYIGPSGLAIIGQFQNFLQLAMTASQGAINSGVTKYTAEYGKGNDKLPVLFSTAFKISVACSIVVCLFLILFSSYAAIIIFNDISYRYLFILLAFTIVFYTLNALLLSILNGLKEIPLFISVNICQSIYSLIFTTMLIFLFGLDGALIALVTNQSVIFLLLLWQVKKHAIITVRSFMSRFSNEEAIKLSKYAGMAITSAIMVPLSHIYIRDYIGNTLSWEEAGYWQAIWYISSMYLMVVTTALSIYYLPRLSEITNKVELKSELLNGYKIILPIISLIALSLFYAKDFVIWLLFTEEFKPMRELFLWQMIGDVIKIASWLLSYVMLAKAMTKVFIITEIVFTALFIILATVSIDKYGLIGITYAFSINYLLYLFFMIFLIKNYLSKKA